jgi:cobalt-precorrin-5B (C1)-methyltransferase
VASRQALRKGYTTGSCATAAAKVAALMVMRQHLIHQVSIVTPPASPVPERRVPHVEGQQAIAAIRKDGGDDVDATHGMLILPGDLNDAGEISLQGGEGIGTVTRKGIGLPTGSPAINHLRGTPSSPPCAKRLALPRRAGGDFCPGRRASRAKPYNARLGILGGISIIGTTGIVPDVGRELEALALPRAGDKTRRRAGAWCWCRATTASALSASRWASTRRWWSP